MISDHEKRFNPRPPLRVGATPPARRRPAPAYRFNPRPPLRVGATPLQPGQRTSYPMFQSSPTAEGGRDRKLCGFGCGFCSVSILAHR